MHVSLSQFAKPSCLADVPFGSKQDTDSERQGEKDTKTDHDPPGSRSILDGPRTVVDQVGNENTNGDEPLVGGD